MLLQRLCSLFLFLLYLKLVLIVAFDSFLLLLLPFLVLEDEEALANLNRMLMIPFIFEY